MLESLTMGRMRASLAIAFVAILFGTLPGAPAVAYDGIFPTPNTTWVCQVGAVPCLADSVGHTYDYSPSLPNYMEREVANTLSDSYRWTDMNFNRVTYDDASTDVYYAGVS